MPLHDTLHRCQPYPGPFELFGAVQALKDAKEFVGIFHVEANPVVTYKNHLVRPALSLSHLDDGAFTATGEFDGIGQQVLQDLPNQDGVAFTYLKFCDAPLDAAVFAIEIEDGK